MKILKVICAGLISLLLTACTARGGGAGQQAEELARTLRGEYLTMEGCVASCAVTADYGQRVYDFSFDVTVVGDTTTLLLTAPEEISGIAVTVERDSSAIQWDGALIETGALTPDGLTPVTAITALLEAAQKGFMDSCTLEQQGEETVLVVLCRPPEQELGTGQETTLTFNPTTGALLRGEIAQDGMRVIDCVFSEFAMQSPQS